MGAKPQRKSKVKTGRPPHKPTDQTRQLVKALVVAGYSPIKADAVLALFCGRDTRVGDGWFHDYYPCAVPQIEEAKR